MICHLTKCEIERDPNLIWNTFINIVAAPGEGLTPSQRPAHLVFIYESEV